MDIQGKILHALPPRSGESARGPWTVQEFVLETNDSFPRKMVFSVFGDERLQRFNIQEGQNVLVSFDIDAHEYNGRWFNSIRAFDVRPFEPTAAAPSPAYSQPQASPQPVSPNSDLANASEKSPEDDLPF